MSRAVFIFAARTQGTRRHQGRTRRVDRAGASSSVLGSTSSRGSRRGARLSRRIVALIDDEFLPLDATGTTRVPGTLPGHRPARHGNAKPAEASVRARSGLVSGQAVALGRHLRGAGHGIRAERAHQRIEAAGRSSWKQRLRSRRVVLAAVLQVMHSHARRRTSRLCTDPAKPPWSSARRSRRCRPRLPPRAACRAPPDKFVITYSLDFAESSIPVTSITSPSIM